MNDHDDTMNYTYTFAFKDGTGRTFIIRLDEKTYDLIPDPSFETPVWARLGNSQCAVCPLDPAEHEYCPIAENITPLINFFSDAVSFEEADITITTPLRSYFKHTSLQKGISSILGIYMVTSGCPVMQKLKPMVKFHLPFASGEETTYRVISMYLLGQYYVYKNGGEADWELENLAKIYNDVQSLNSDFGERLRKGISQDAGINALVILDMFANYVLYELDESIQRGFQELFMTFS